MRDAQRAVALFQSYAPRCGRVAGMDTASRMAVRIQCGRSVEQAAARGYLYRWSLTLDCVLNRIQAQSRARGEPVFRAPHTLGM